MNAPCLLHTCFFQMVSGNGQGDVSLPPRSAGLLLRGGLGFPLKAGLYIPWILQTSDACWPASFAFPLSPGKSLSDLRYADEYNICPVTWSGAGMESAGISTSATGTCSPVISTSGQSSSTCLGNGWSGWCLETVFLGFLVFLAGLDSWLSTLTISGLSSSISTTGLLLLFLFFCVDESDGVIWTADVLLRLPRLFTLSCDEPTVGDSSNWSSRFPPLDFFLGSLQVDSGASASFDFLPVRVPRRARRFVFLAPFRFPSFLVLVLLVLDGLLLGLPRGFPCSL